MQSLLRRFGIASFDPDEAWETARAECEKRRAQWQEGWELRAAKRFARQERKGGVDVTTYNFEVWGWEEPHPKDAANTPAGTAPEDLAGSTTPTHPRNIPHHVDAEGSPDGAGQGVAPPGTRSPSDAP